MTDFKSSATAKNLMRAFAGESQARNRYTLAAGKAKEQKLPVLQAVFLYTADQEGFSRIAQTFRMIADVEKTHADRFQMFGKLMEEGRLFVSDVETGWVCLNCGHVHQGKEAPQTCPVCQHEQGYFIRMELAPWTASGWCGK